MRFSCVVSVTGRPSSALYQVAADSMSLTGMKTCPMRLVNGEVDVTPSRLDEDLHSGTLVRDRAHEATLRRGLEW
jgi:hypothetical protein